MNINEAIDKALPRVATWPPYVYDLTDKNARPEAIAWVRELIKRINECYDT